MTQKRMRPKKVLIITYFFPPRYGSGSVRPMGLAKHLPKFGWEPVILTAKLPGVAPAGIRIIETEYRNILGGVKQLFGYRPNIGLHEQLNLSVGKNGRNGSLSSRLIFAAKAAIAFPDEHIGWLKFAIREGKRLIEKENIEAILSISSPATAHLIARSLKTETRKPWIADFRDLWTQNHYYCYGLFRSFIERILEVRTLAQADAIVTAHPLINRLRELHRIQPVYCIPNGFDPEEFINKNAFPKGNSKFIMTYTGELYCGKRDPEILFLALSELINSREIERSQVEVRFFSEAADWLREDIRKYNLQDIISIYGQLPRAEVLQRQVESTLLFILTWNNPVEVNIYPGKLFEYLGAGRPILAIGGPGGVVKELLEKTQAGVYVSSLVQLKKVIMEYYKTYRSLGTIPYNVVEEEVQIYTQRVMAQKFALVLDEVVASQN